MIGGARHRRALCAAAASGLRVGRADRFLAYLASELWPSLPEGQRGRCLSKEEEEEELLGLGPGGA